MKKITTIEFLNYPKMTMAVLAYIDELQKSMEIDPKKALRFRLACEEVIAQRMKNAYAKEGTFFADFYASNTELEFSLRDLGEPYWLSEPSYDPSAAKDDLTGIENFLIYKNVDKMGLEKLGREGQRFFVRIAVKLHVRPKQEQLSEEPPLDTDFRFKSVTDDDNDITAAISCIYNEYGYSYAYEALYYPENFKSMTQSGMFHSYLAVNAHEEVAGHFGLSETDYLKGMPEICTVVVKHRFRGLKIADKMFKYAVEEAKRQGKKSIWCQPTAYHTGTQHICTKLGFTATGFLFQYVNPDLESEYNREKRRLDLTMCVRLFEPQTYRICCPDEIAPFVVKILKRAGMEGELVESSLPTGESAAKMDINTRVLSAKIIISRVGLEIEDTVKSMLRSCRKNKTEMAELMLSLDDAAAPFAYDILKKHGFFFTGIVPGSENGVYCMMQHLFDSEPDFSVIVTESEYTEVLDDIRKIYMEA